MKTITIGRSDCDIIIPDNNVSRKHATISLIDGQYVLQDMSRNGTVINGQVYHNARIVITPGTPVYLANKVALPWPQVLMLLPNSGVKVQPVGLADNPTIIQNPVVPEDDESIGVGWGLLSFFFPIIGFILYFVWRDDHHAKAKQAANIAWISIGINLLIGFIASM